MFVYYCQEGFDSRNSFCVSSLSANNRSMFELGSAGAGEAPTANGLENGEQSQRHQHEANPQLKIGDNDAGALPAR
jgi:hypothetical protein